MRRLKIAAKVEGLMSPKDRRTEERLSVTKDTQCALASPLTEDLGAVRIKNVSTHGIGLIIGQRLEIGTLLSVTLVNNAKSFARSYLVQVAHVTAQGGSFLVGGTFTTPLTYEELTTLVM